MSRESESALVVSVDSMDDEKSPSFSVAYFIPKKSEFHAESISLRQSAVNLHAAIENNVDRISDLQESLNVQLAERI